MKKKIISLVTALLLMMSVIPTSTVNVNAATIPPAKSITYTCTGNQADDIVGIANTQVGYVDNGVYTAYGQWYGTQTEWCAMFVSWCANKAGIPTSVIPKLNTADRSWYQNKGLYKKAAYWGGSYTPKKGDIIFFDWDNEDYAKHVGIVTSVSGSYVYTIEGNTSDSVAKRSYKLNDPDILGYGTPKYTSSNTYTIAYSDGDGSTSYAEDALIIPSHSAKSGANTATTAKKFTRSGYHYNKWYIFKLVDGKAHYWCREKSTNDNPKWIAYDQIPSNYYKVSIAHGGKIYFSMTNTKIYLTPVWEINTYTLRYSDGISSTSYDADSKIIPNQTAKSGQYTTTATKKFNRTGYSYNSWYIFKLINGKAHYWCREKKTNSSPKWIAYDKIPSNYYKVAIAHGGKIQFTTEHNSTIFLTPAWKYNSKDINNLNIKLSKNSYTYTGKKIYPAVTVKTKNNATLKKGTDYIATYQKSPSKVGTYKVTLKGKGNYTGTKAVYYVINPKGTSIKSLSKGKKSFKVKWKKNSTQTTGYQIRYSTSSKMSKATIKTIKSYKTTSSTIKSLKSKKKYYVQVRTYKTVGSQKYYSAWSSKKTVKTK